MPPRTPGDSVDALILKLPVIGPVLGKISLARFANTFAMLYGSGISVLQALSITHGVVDNRAIRAALQDVEKSIQDGSNIAEAFTSHRTVSAVDHSHAANW